MGIKEICDVIFKLFLYADAAKMIHYNTESNHEHELSDRLCNETRYFADNLAEQIFGFYGKPSFSDMTLKQDISPERDLNKLAQKCIDTVSLIRTAFAKNDKLSGIVSSIDDYKRTMSQFVFLGTFDKVSNYNLKK